MNSSVTVNDTLVSSGFPLWYQHDYCRDVPYGFLFYYTVKVINFIVGVPANFMVMWHVARKKTDPSTSDIFIFNLALLDGFFGLTTPSELVSRLVVTDDRLKYFQQFAYGIKDTTPLFLSCITLDRYVAVVHPIVFTGIRDNKIRIALSLLVWALILAFSIAKSILGEDCVNEIFSGLILTAFSITVFCNISIIWVLRRSVMGKEVMHPTKKKAFRMVLIILAFTVALYLPPVAVFPFAKYYSIVTFKCQVSYVVFSIMDLSCSIEPLLYISKFEKLSCFKSCRHCQSRSKTRSG